MTTNPWTNGILPRKTIKLICIAVNAACTNHNQDWCGRSESFFNLDPLWTEQFMATGLPVYTGELIPLKLAELLSIALDASYTHMYAPGTRRHIKAALKLGATPEEIMEVLKLCVVQGVQACNPGIPILAEELAAHQNVKDKS